MRIDGDTESNWCIKIGLDDENFLVNCEGLINCFDDFDCLWTLLLFGIWIIYCWSINLLIFGVKVICQVKGVEFIQVKSFKWEI